MFYVFIDGINYSWRLCNLVLVTLVYYHRSCYTFVILFCLFYSSTSIDISPMLNIKKTPRKKPLRPRAAYNKTSPVVLAQIPQEIFDSDTSSSRKDSPDTVFLGHYDPGVMSPKSYLSMPSVKAFPRYSSFHGTW